MLETKQTLPATAQQKLEFAAKINDLIDREFPNDYDDQKAETLALALMARAGASYVKCLFGCAS